MSKTTQGTEITMPKLGESVTEGTLGSWLKSVGDVVDKYEPMVEVVTDKVTAEIPAPVGGTITAIIGGEGETIPVGGVICVIDEGNGAVASDSDPVIVDDAVPDLAAEAEAPPQLETPQPAMQEPIGAPRQLVDVSQLRVDRDEAELLRVRSSPIVRRLAEEHEIDITSLEGSGIGGRVTKSDMLQAIKEHASAPATQPQPAAPAVAQQMPTPVAQPMPQQTAEAVQLMPGDEVIEATLMRRQIADHMVKSVYTAPHVTVWMEVDMSRVVAARERQKGEFGEREGYSLTYVPFVLQVLVEALRTHPEVNAAWDNGKIIRRKAINIGVAVAMEDGLIVPVIKNADGMSLVGLARSVNDLATRAREQKLTADDITGGTFTLNNPGTLGSMFSTPIIVQPQAAILSMEAIVKKAVVIDDAIAIRPMMNLSLSLDHRILDGLVATRFLAAVKRGLEEYGED